MTGEWTDGIPEDPADPGGDAAGPDTSAQGELFAHIYGHAEAEAEPEAHDERGLPVDDATDADNLDGGYDAAEGPEIEDDEKDAGEWPGLTEDADAASYLIEPSTEYGDEPVFQETPDPAPTAGQEWVNAIGAGAVDPSGELPKALGGFGFHDPSTVAYGTDPGGIDPNDTDPFDIHSGDIDPDWSTMSDLDTQHWTQSGLLDGLDLLPTGSVDGGGQELDGPAGVQALWARLSPGQPMPTTDEGSPDLTAALDQLTAGAGSPLLDVIDAARRLVG